MTAQTESHVAAGVPLKQLPPDAHQPQPTAFRHVSSTLIDVQSVQHWPWATSVPEQLTSVGVHAPSHQWQIDSTVHAPQLLKLAQ